MKKIGFLSFGHWSPSSQSQTRSAADALLQSIDLAVAAEELGADGAYFRVHHFARQLGSPFPLLAAIGARTNRIEIGTAVIDMRYENPMYMAEDAGAADIIAGGRLQLGISRGSPEQVIDGWRHFGYTPRDGELRALCRAITAPRDQSLRSSQETGIQTLVAEMQDPSILQWRIFSLLGIIRPGANRGFTTWREPASPATARQ